MPITTNVVIRIPLRRGVLDTTLCDKVYQWLAACRWFSSGTPVSLTNKTDSLDIAEILLKVTLNTTILTHHHDRSWHTAHLTSNNNQSIDRNNNNHNMLKELEWPTLQQWRTNTKMVMLYRIVHHLIPIQSQMYLTPATTRTTRDHDQKFQIPFSRIQSHQNAYFPSAIRTWNNLTAVLANVPTCEASKVELAHV